MKPFSWIELNLGILKQNIQKLQNLVGANTEIILVVKSNAYGHGLIPVSRCGWECGIRWFAVADLEEALRIREILPEAEILVLGVIHPEDASSAVKANVNVTIVSEHHAESLNQSLTNSTLPLRCHIKIDTGMGRLGLPYEYAIEIIRKIAKLRKLKIEGLFTHFAVSDELQNEFTEIQALRFRRIVEECKRGGLSTIMAHASNSGGILRSRKWDFDAVRPGIVVYGYSPFGCRGSRESSGIEIPTQPFLFWKSCVLQTKRVPRGFMVGYGSTYITPADTQIVTIGVGYGDGYSRLLSNKGRVIIRDKFCPVVGRVNMNFICADIGLDLELSQWEEVTLIGGNESVSIWADEIADLCDTIPYEVLTSIKTKYVNCLC
jgi:alanine racemase